MSKDIKKIGTYNINRTIWTIFAYEDTNNDFHYDDFYRVFKNGKKADFLANGSDYETETEAEINILNEYRVK